MQPVKLGAWVSCLGTFALFAAFVLASPSRAQEVETSQQTNERLRTIAAASHVAPPRDYVIGSGDVVSVQVFDVPELSRELRVSQTGTVGIPLISVRLHLAGLTEIQAERKIQEVLEANGLVSHAEVSVVVKEKKSKPITVVGAVGHPMVYQADRQVTLIEVLAEAGGISGDAGDTVIVTRPEPDASTDPAADASEPPEISPEDARPPQGREATTPSPVPDSQKAVAPASFSEPRKPTADAAGPPQIAPPTLSSTITVNLNQILETGEMNSNIVLQPGDVVTVPHAGIVYVLGAVQRPGGFVVSNDRKQLTTLKVLSLAGGLNRTAKSDRAVIVRKDATGQQREVEVDLRKVMKFESEDLQLRPSDILYVPNSGAKTALIKTGEIALGIGTGVLIYRLIR
jgi:polysaccharide export outer membrane protein